MSGHVGKDTRATSGRSRSRTAIRIAFRIVYKSVEVDGPWISYATPGVAATAQTSFSGLDLGKTIGAVYLILLNAALAAVVCYLSSKAAPPRKLIFAGWLAFIGALCGPANLMALIFVSKLSAIAGAGLWIFSLGYTAIAAGGLMSIRDFSKRVY